MKDDSISRQLAVDAVLGVIPYDEYWLEQVNKAIEALPSAQRWIPMSERLPEKDGRYLCSYGKHIHITQMLNHHFRHYGEIADHLISAWMPLPEPYRAAGGETDGEA